MTPPVVHHPELDGEPEDVGDELQGVLGLQALAGLSRGLRDRREAPSSPRLRVADDLVDDVGLRRVQRLARVAQVLGGVEGAAPEVGVELAEGNQPGAAV